MKQLFVLFAVLLMVCSCSDEILNEDNHQAILGASNVTFSFDSITEPSNWRKYQSLEEMLAACQIPEGKLKSMSTDELIEVCMSHPLCGIYSAYNNEMEGVKVIVNNFNGFVELRKRKDASTDLLHFYEAVLFNPQYKSESHVNYTDPAHIGFIELYIASRDIKDIYDEPNISELERISNSVLDFKLLDKEVPLSSIRHTLLINAQVKLEQNRLQPDDLNILRQFVNSSGSTRNPKDYTTISKILSE